MTKEEWEELKSSGDKGGFLVPEKMTELLIDGEWMDVTEHREEDEK